MTLQQIGYKNSTDKSDAIHSFNGKSYLYWYEKYLEEYRNKDACLLEIGIFNGNSLRTWQDYFSLAKINGIDIEDKKKHETQRIKTFQGDQSDPTFISSVLTQIGNPDIIIDDGSHINHLTLKSFDLLFPSLKSGGIYIIEDLMCSYHPNIIQDVVQWPGMDKVMALGHEMHNDRKLIDDFLLSKIKELDHKRGAIEFIHNYSMFVVIKKV